MRDGRKVVKIGAGIAMIILGVAINVWMWIGAKVVGVALGSGVYVGPLLMPATFPLMAGLCLIVFGLVLACNAKPAKPRS